MKKRAGIVSTMPACCFILFICPDGSLTVKDRRGGVNAAEIPVRAVIKGTFCFVQRNESGKLHLFLRLFIRRGKIAFLLFHPPLLFQSVNGAHEIPPYSTRWA